jgi:hypothetical protein
VTKWKKQTLKLKDKHFWRCKSGYRILVLDRGAVRFDIPGGWVLNSLKAQFRCSTPSRRKDDCRIEVSFSRLPPHDYTGFPIAKALQDVYKDDFRRLTPTIDPVNIVRHDLRAAWAEYSFVDPVEIRDAFTCALIGIGNNVQCLITCDFWASDAARIRPVWNELVRTLQLGVHVADPTTGRAQVTHLN